MKYLVFIAMFVIGIPVVAIGSARSAGFRMLCWAAFSGFVALGDLSGVNFFSIESYRGTDRGYELAFMDMYALGLLLAGKMGAPKKPVTARMSPPGLFFFIAYLAFSIPGILLSINPLYGIFTVWKMLRVIFFFALVWTAGRTDAEPRVVFDGIRRGLVFGLLIVGIMGMKQKFLDGMYRVNGTFDHSNSVPLYVNISAAPIFMWILGYKKLGRLEFLLSFAAVGAALVAVLATQSRLGILLAGVSVGGALMVSNFAVATRRARSAAVVFVMAALIGGFMVMDTLIDRIKNAPESSEQAREEFNISAQEMAADNFFGVGLNNFSVTMTEVSKYRSHVEVMANEEHAGVAHHLYLLTAAESGYVGLGFLVLTFLSIDLYLARFAFRRRSDQEKRAVGILPYVAVATGFGHVALYMSGFFEWAFRITPIMAQYFVVSAVILSAVSRTELDGAVPITPLDTIEGARG